MIKCILYNAYVHVLHLNMTKAGAGGRVWKAYKHCMVCIFHCDPTKFLIHISLHLVNYMQLYPYEPTYRTQTWKN